MVIENLMASPHRRSAPLKKFEFGSFSALVHRHRFLLTALTLLAFLCTVYLYFAITLGSRDACSGLTGTEKALCHLKDVTAATKGNLKIIL